MGVGWDLGDVTRAIEGFAGIEFDTSDVTIAVSELNETMTGIGQTLERIAEALERAQEAPRPLPPIIYPPEPEQPRKLTRRNRARSTTY